MFFSQILVVSREVDATHGELRRFLDDVDVHWANMKQEGEVYTELEQIGDAVRTGDWSNTSLGAAIRLRCPQAGLLTLMAEEGWPYLGGCRKYVRLGH